MSRVRSLALAALVLTSAPALAQQPDTVRIAAAAPSGRPTLMSYIANKPIPETVDALLARLNEPDVCGASVPNAERPCAIVAYYLMDRDPALRTPQLVFRAIQFVSHADNPVEATLRMVDLDGGFHTYSDQKLDEPLRPMRVQNSCTRTWMTMYNPPRLKRVCKKVNAHYVPFGILGYGENEEQGIFTGKVKDAFFSLTLSEEEGKARGVRD